jgi:biotin synthesis protein BioG
LKSAIAINGTLCPIHDQFGIPVQLYNTTLNQFSQISRLKFYRRMCRSGRAFETFLENQPKRSVENQGRELAALQGHVHCDLADTPIYTKIMIADHDFIVPTVNQKTFWQEHEVLRVKGGHFLFYDWNSWDELIATSLGTKEETQNIS